MSIFGSKKQFDEDTLNSPIDPLNIDELDLPEDDETPDPLMSPSPTEQFEKATQVPDYVEHLEGVGNVVMLSAAAIVQQYETTAKAIEGMGKELVAAALLNEKSTNEIHEALKYLEEVANKYRDEGKKLFKQIEQSGLITAHVREVCDTVMNKKTENPSD